VVDLNVVLNTLSVFEGSIYASLKHHRSNTHWSLEERETTISHSRPSEEDSRFSMHADIVPCSLPTLLWNSQTTNEHKSQLYTAGYIHLVLQCPTKWLLQFIPPRST